MSILNWFAQKKRDAQPATDKLDIPSDLWVKCSKCAETLYLKDLEDNFKVCLKCDFHFRLTPEDRLKYFFDRGSFKEVESDIAPKDFLSFVDEEAYTDRLKRAQNKTKRPDAVIIGTAKLNRRSVNVGVMDFGFMGGSMGSVVGEKITRLVELGCRNRHPVIVFSSSGGARMQEGIMSLMQMAKTSAALAKLEDCGVPYISILCDPTTGGTSASFAMLGDINIAEPGALITFAGPRVIEQTIRQKLPEGFQRAEFLLDKGMVDMVVHRNKLRKTLNLLTQMLGNHGKRKQ